MITIYLTNSKITTYLSSAVLLFLTYARREMHAFSNPQASKQLVVWSIVQQMSVFLSMSRNCFQYHFHYFPSMHLDPSEDSSSSILPNLLPSM
mmetsp:Transcript_7530/g.10953  ORF Transcript_7530/g.10953 Transcript_7530/m.10953 type:complete len:93 (-) Transcript_7530:60-338(-)